MPSTTGYCALSGHCLPAAAKNALIALGAYFPSAMPCVELVRRPLLVRFGGPCTVAECGQCHIYMQEKILTLSHPLSDCLTGGDMSQHELARRDTSSSRRDRDLMKRERSHSPHGDVPPVAPPNFERSGLLAKESNNVNGVALKYHEPPEAKKPRHTWRLYVFKDGHEKGMWSSSADNI